MRAPAPVHLPCFALFGRPVLGESALPRLRARAAWRGRPASFTRLSAPDEAAARALGRSLGLAGLLPAETGGEPAPPPAGPVALIGFSGAGKSSVGALLAARLSWELLDTDRMVEAEAGCPIPALFAAEGEQAFRARERAAVARALARPRAVVALGAGSLSAPGAASLPPEARLILLFAPLEVSLTRIRAGTRPLLDAGADPAALLAQRLPGWLARADLVLDSAREDVDALAAVLERELQAAGIAP